MATSDKKKTPKRRQIDLHVLYEGNKGILGYYKHQLATAKLFKANLIYIEVLESRIAKLEKLIRAQKRKLDKMALETTVVPDIEEQTLV